MCLVRDTGEYGIRLDNTTLSYGEQGSLDEWTMLFEALADRDEQGWGAVPSLGCVFYCVEPATSLKTPCLDDQMAKEFPIQTPSNSADQPAMIGIHAECPLRSEAPAEAQGSGAQTCRGIRNWSGIITPREMMLVGRYILTCGVHANRMPEGGRPPGAGIHARSWSFDRWQFGYPGVSGCLAAFLWFFTQGIISRFVSTLQP